MPKIIAENEWLIAIDKPAGLIVHSDGRTEEPTLASWLIERYPNLAPVGDAWVSPQGVAYPIAGAVHRLDRTTSGVMLIAKNNDAFQYLRNEFKMRRVEKRYRALVYGKLEGSGRIVAEIMRSTESPRRWYAVETTEANRRAAITDWKFLTGKTDPLTGAYVSLLEALPRTGRTHQLRVHFACIGYPIVADHLYAPERPALFGFTRPALHAYQISLTLPDGQLATYTAEMPFDGFSS